MIKNKQQYTTNDSTQKLNIRYKNIGECVFTTLMSFALIGIVVFYASLPIRSAAYRQNSQTEFLALDSVITETEGEVDTHDLSEAETDADIQLNSDKDTDSTTSIKKQYAKVIHDGLNVREGSTVNTETIGKAYMDEEYELVEILDEIQWAKIIYNGDEAFVHTKFIEVITK